MATGFMSRYRQRDASEMSLPKTNDLHRRWRAAKVRQTHRWRGLDSKFSSAREIGFGFEAWSFVCRRESLRVPPKAPILREGSGGSGGRTLGPRGLRAVPRFPDQARPEGGLHGLSRFNNAHLGCPGRRCPDKGTLSGGDCREEAAICTARDDPMPSRAASAASARSDLVRAMRPRMTRHSSSATAVIASITAAEGVSCSSRNKRSRASLRPIRPSA